MTNDFVYRREYPQWVNVRHNTLYCSLDKRWKEDNHSVTSTSKYKVAKEEYKIFHISYILKCPKLI